MNMKVNYNAKTGDSIKLQTGNGCQGEFHVLDTYPSGVVIIFGNQRLSLDYEQLKQMDAEFCLSEIPDLDAVEWTLNAYIDIPKEVTEVLIELYDIVGKRLSKAKHDEDLKSYGEWLPMYQKLSKLVSELSI